MSFCLQNLKTLRISIRWAFTPFCNPECKQLLFRNQSKSLSSSSYVALSGNCSLCNLCGCILGSCPGTDVSVSNESRISKVDFAMIIFSLLVGYVLDSFTSCLGWLIISMLPGSQGLFL